MASEDELSAVKEAIRTGALRVRTRVNGVDTEVEYPSFDDLKARHDFLLREEARAAGAARPNVVLAVFSRGG